jgi:hypothetical protein
MAGQRATSSTGGRVPIVVRKGKSSRIADELASGLPIGEEAPLVHIIGVNLEEG